MSPVILRNCKVFMTAAVQQASHKSSGRTIQLKTLQSHSEVISFAEDFVTQMEYQEAVAVLYQMCYKKKPSNIQKFRKSKILYQVLRIVFDNLKSLSAFEIVRVISSLTAIDHKPMHFMQKLEDCATKLIPKMNSIDISILVYNYSRLNLQPAELLENALTRGKNIIDEFDAKSISTILQGLGELQFVHGEFMEVATQRLEKLLPEMDPFPLSISIQALGKLCCYDEQLMDQVKKIVQNKIIEFSPHHLCMIIYGCVRVNYHPCDLFDQIAECFTDGSKRVKSIDVATIIWAMGHFGYVEAKEQCIQMAQILSKDMQDISPVTLANSLWGLALMDCSQVEVYQQLIDQASVLYKRKQMEPSLLRQVFQSYNISKNKGNISIDPQLRAEGCKWWMTALHDFQLSPAFKNLNMDLKRLKIDFQSDVSTDDGLHRIDFVFKNKDLQLVALQISGLYERAINTNSLLGSPSAQNVLLEEKGYVVINFNGWKYSQRVCDGSQLHFLERFLRQQVNLDIPENTADKIYELESIKKKRKLYKRKLQQRMQAKKSQAAVTLLQNSGAEVDAIQQVDQGLFDDDNEIDDGYLSDDDDEHYEINFQQLQEKKQKQQQQQVESQKSTKMNKKSIQNGKASPRIGLPAGLKVVKQQMEGKTEK